MTGEPKSASIKTKVMIGFGLIICGVLFVGFIAYKSFNLLVNSIDQISQPDTKITLLNKIVRDIAEAEIILRESTLRSDISGLEPFFVYADSVNNRLDSLRVLFVNEPETILMLDSITILINEKLQGADGYVKLYSRQKSTDYYKKAINEITAKEITTSEVDTSLANNGESINIDSAVLVLDSITNLRTEKKKNGFLRSKKRKREDSIKQAEEHAKAREQIESVLDEINKSKEKETAIVPGQSAVVTDTVTKIIANIKREEQRSEYAITLKELEIIDNNSLILNQVKFLITEMEEVEANERRQNIIKARETSNNAIMIIIATGILGTFSGIMFIYIIFNDITKRNYYRRLLVKAREKAIREGKAKEDFLANMSHEIRTPLNAILGFSEQLSNTSLEKTQDEYLKAITSSSSHLLATVNDVLDFSKIQANKLSIEEIPFKLINVVKDVYATLILKAEQKNIKLKYSFDEQLNQVLAGDPFRLKQILLNLVNNGIKFTDKGHVEIKAILEKEFKTKLIARIEVNDTGIGIAEENINEIFEGFSQSDSSTTRKYGGTGLGLSISKKLVELQHGTLKAKSEVGQGSTFIVELTLKKAKDFKPLPQESTMPSNDHVFNGYKVMVVDDDKLNLQLTEIIFKKWGLQSDFVINGKAATEKLEQDFYNLIITDIQMPEFSGIDLAKHVRSLKDAKRSQTPILAFTANVMKDDLQKYLDSGINDYLLKPFKEAHLFNKIVSALKIEVESGNESNGQPKKVQKQPGNNGTACPLYNLDEILQFTGERNESLLEVLESFIYNTKNSLLMMDSGLKSKDWEKVRMMAHKMLPSFQHLKVSSVIPILKKLEILNGHPQSSEVGPLVYKVEEGAKDVMKALKKEIISLKQELSAKQLP